MTHKIVMHKIVALAGVLFALLTNLVMLPSSPIGQTAAASVGPCKTAQVAIILSGGSAGMGHVGTMYTVRNISAQTCTLFGYPGAQLLDSKTHPIPTHVTWGVGYLAGSQPRTLVTLTPGGTAYFSLEWVHFPTPNQTCPTSSFLKVTMPNATDNKIIKVTLRMVCGGNLTASPLEPKPLDGFYAGGIADGASTSATPAPISTPSAATGGSSSVFIFGRKGGNIMPFMVTISANGAVTTSGPLQTMVRQLSADTLDGLRTLAKAEGFATMPSLVTGKTLMPDVATLYIEMPASTGHGMKDVQVHAVRVAAFDQLFAVLTAAVGMPM